MKFLYEGISQEGAEVGGNIDAIDRRGAIVRLEGQGITPTRLEVAETRKRSAGIFQGRPGQRETLLMMRELATLLRSGVPIAEAVGSLASSGHHPQLVDGFGRMSRHIRQGGSFSEALKQSGIALPWYFHHLAEAGEMTGKLADSLRDGANQLDYDLQVSADLRSALVYPSILVFSGIAAIVIIFMAVVPTFANMVEGDPQAVHWLGRAVIGTGMWFNDNQLLVALLGALMVAGAVWTTRNSAAQRLLYQWLARLPLIGDWILESETGRWATTLSTLLTNRVDLVRGLELAREGLQLAFLRARLTEVLRAVRGGSTLADALSDHGAITGTGIDLVRVGERSGALPEMLSSLGELYDVTSRDRMKRVLQMIEPLAILIIGTSIGIIITGVILAVMGGQEAGF